MLFLIYFYYATIAVILSAYDDQFVAVLYVSRLSAGTYIGQIFVSSNADEPPNVGGVVACIVIDVKPVQPSNALSPIEVTELGMVTLVKPVHWLNAKNLIEVTEFGIVIEVSLSQL